MQEKPAQEKPAAPAAATPVASNDPSISAEFNAFMDWEVKVHTPINNFRERDEARIYSEMLDILIARGAKVCLVNFPVDRHYRARANVTPEYAAVREFYKELAAQRGRPYVSFWDRFDDPSMFQNTDHVNQKGATILDRGAHGLFW